MKLTMRAVLAFATASLLSAGMAQAADYDPPIVVDEVEEVPVEVGSGWYLRGDIGYVVAQKTGTYSYRTYNPFTGYGAAAFETASLRKPFSYGVGVGYHVNDMIRLDATVDSFSTRFQGSTSSIFPCTVSLPGTGCASNDVSKANITSVMANAYVDLATVAGFTPYVGAGAGMSYVSWNNLNNQLYCVGAACGGGFNASIPHFGISEWRFSWQAMAGVAYAITKNFKVDLGYRYRETKDGNMFRWDEASANAGAAGAQGYDSKLSQHEVRVGLRYDLW